MVSINNVWEFVPDKQNGDAGVVLRTSEFEMVFQSIELRLGNAVAVKLADYQHLLCMSPNNPANTYIVEEVHAPESWLRRSVSAQSQSMTGTFNVLTMIRTSSLRTSAISSGLDLLTAPE